MVGSPVPLLVALNVVGVNLISPVLPAYAAHFGVGFAAVSTLIAVFAGARMTMRVTAGSLADRFGPRRVCASGGAVQLVGALLALAAPGFGLLLGARGVQGVGSALFGTSINRHLLVTTKRDDLGRATAGYQGSILVGSTAGPVVGGVIAEQFGIFAPFALQACIATALVGACLIVIREPGIGAGTRARTPRPSIRSLIGLRGFRLVMFIGFGLFVVRAGVANLLVPAFAGDILRISPALIGTIISVGSIVSLVVMPFAGRLADSAGRWPVAMIGAFGSAAAVGLFSLATTVSRLVAVTALAGVGAGFDVVAMPTMMGDLIPAGTEGRATGVYRIANDLGWIIGPLALGVLAARGSYTGAFLLAAVPLAVGGFLLWRSDDLRDERFVR